MLRRWKQILAAGVVVASAWFLAPATAGAAEWSFSFGTYGSPYRPPACHYIPPRVVRYPYVAPPYPAYYAAPYSSFSFGFGDPFFDHHYRGRHEHHDHHGHGHHSRH